MKYFKEHWPLLVGLGLPALLILVVFFAYYLPGKTAKPTLDFIFVMDNYGSSNIRYEVRGDTLQAIDFTRNDGFNNAPFEPKTITNKKPILYRYDMKTDKSVEVTFEQVKALRLDTNFESPEGFRIEYSRGGGGLIFGSFSNINDYNSRYITKGASSSKLNLPSTTSYYGSQFEFLGWVK